LYPTPASSEGWIIIKVLGLGYEFENIESQIGSVLALANSKKFKDEDSKTILDSITLECERVKKAFKQLVLSAEVEKRVRRCFHFHQEALTGLIDKTDESEKCRAAVLLAAIRKLLVDLLDTFRDQFPEFFNYDARIPGCLAESTISELTQSADFLSAKFSATAIDPVLLDVTLDSFKALEMVSYRKVDYLRRLHQHLFGLDISVNDPNLLRQDLCKVLINCNYNTVKFFDYYTRSVKKSLINCETLSDRIDLVSWFLKECNQEQCLQKISFDPQLPPIHVQLGEWLTQELEYYREKQQLLSSVGLREDGLNKDFKLNFDLSVSQLAYLLKALIETGVLRNKNTSQLIRFLVKFVKTKKSESVSYDSFRMKFYNPESGTKDAVKKTLQSLLQYMNKN
jgi:hypothetical protein